MTSLSRFLLLLLLLLASGRNLLAQELAVNGSFESGAAGWSIYVPDESTDKNCTFTVVADNPHTGAACAEFNSNGPARFCIGQAPIPLTPGDHVRISAWFRAGPLAQFPKRTPGVSMRLTFRKDKANVPNAHLQVNGESVVTPGNPVALKNPVPTQWIQVSVVIEVPPYVDSVSADIFSYANGPLFLDDFSVRKVARTQPVTPLEGGASYASLSSAAAASAMAAGSGPPPPVLPASPGPVTTDAQMIAELNLDLPGLEKVKAAVQTGQLPAIKAAYLDYRRHISTAKWTRMPGQVLPKVTPQTIALADQIANNSVARLAYHYGPPVTFMGKDFNWKYNPVPPSDPAFSNEFTYCVVSRTEWWQVLADVYEVTHNEKYAQAWVAQLEDFAAKNPVDPSRWQGKPSLWRTLDTGTRMNVSWPYCYFRFRDSPSFTPDAQWIYGKMMRDQAAFLAAGLQDQTRTGNWVTDECAGLYTVGALFPEMKTAAAWRAAAVQRLTLESTRTFEPDGMESELAPGYHYGAASQLKSPYDMARLNNLPIPDSFRATILNAYRAPVVVMDQTGHVVPTNDSTSINVRYPSRDALTLGDDPLLKWAATNGREGTQPPDSTMLPDAGFYAMRSGWEGWDAFIFFRAGPPGTGHEHQEKLEVVMRAWDANLLFDPGTYTYDKSQFRRYFIATPSHNTIIVDGKWQHSPENQAPFTPVSNPWITTPLFDYVAGTYSDGYQENQYAASEFSPQKWIGEPDKSVSHTRRLLYLRPYCALVLDTLDGTGRHTFEAHWNMDAVSAHVDPSSQAIISDNPTATTGADAHIALIPLDRANLTADVVQGQKSPVLLGWKPNDNHPSPIPTGRFLKTQDAPAVFATILYPFRHSAVPSVHGEPLTTADGIWAQTLTTPEEKAEIAVVKDGSTKPISFTSALLGHPVQVEGAGLLIRQPQGSTGVFSGGWDLKSYNEGTIAFTPDAPASLLVIHGDHPLFYNGGDKPVTLTFTRPAPTRFTIPPRSWANESGKPVSKAPTLFSPFLPPRKPAAQ